MKVHLIVLPQNKNYRLPYYDLANTFFLIVCLFKPFSWAKRVLLRKGTLQDVMAQNAFILFRLEERLNFQKIIIKAGKNMFHDLNDGLRKQQGDNLYRGGVVFIPVVNNIQLLTSISVDIRIYLPEK